ncbi:ABC transporter substrate-binding protein [Longimicrobium sp.]|jgi:iron complex transport system substrate-binding protein|uniref:ABC transporter substrate-binding protein n=1 Tax=Longimicrobium sp. TaxID=2029185 RepID=UPI002ED915AD
MRIASLLSSATEIVYALGLQEHLVAISHECDWPPQALHLPRLSRSRFDPAGLTSGQIDAEVRRCMLEYGSVYEIDVAALRDARPDVILTQAVCEVCAVPTGSVNDAVAALPFAPRVVSLDAHTMEGIFQTMQQVADAVGQPERGDEAVARLRGRLRRVEEAIASRPRPRVLALEWLDPPFAPGHWIPEMVTLAGGDNLLGDAGSRSVQIPWEQADGLDPDRLLLLPCGYDLQASRIDADRARDSLARIAPEAIAAGRAAIGHSAYFSRSGPRVVDGTEALAAWLHPDAGLAAPAEPVVDPWP